jgi:hypothetical protein
MESALLAKAAPEVTKSRRYYVKAYDQGAHHHLPRLAQLSGLFSR